MIRAQIAAMKARTSEQNIGDGCIKIPAPLLKSFRGVVGHHLAMTPQQIAQMHVLISVLRYKIAESCSQSDTSITQLHVTYYRQSSQ